MELVCWVRELTKTKKEKYTNLKIAKISSNQIEVEVARMFVEIQKYSDIRRKRLLKNTRKKALYNIRKKIRLEIWTFHQNE